MVNAMRCSPKLIMKRKNRELLKTPGSFYVDETCCFSALTLALLFALYSVTFSMVSPSIWSAQGLSNLTVTSSALMMSIHSLCFTCSPLKIDGNTTSVFSLFEPCQTTTERPGADPEPRSFRRRRTYRSSWGRSTPFCSAFPLRRRSRWRRWA